jgi:hypothetical protein
MGRISRSAVARMLGINYRLAPEFRFPAALEKGSVKDGRIEQTNYEGNRQMPSSTRSVSGFGRCRLRRKP